MSQPLGFIDPQHPNKVCLLQKSIDGLLQTPHAWYNKLSGFLIFVGFVISTSDSSLFCWKNKNDCVLLLVYIDCIIIIWSSQQIVSELINRLSKQFRLKDMGSLKFFLGMELTKIPSIDCYLLSQTRYVEDLFKRTSMDSAKLTITPMVSTTKLNSVDGVSLLDKFLY